MKCGEKIRELRKKRGISQNQLGELAGIAGTTIRKYELGIRNPKPEQLKKISYALGVSIWQFADYGLQTESDILYLLIKMQEQGTLEIAAEKDSEGNFIPDTVRICFKCPEINKRLAEYGKIKKEKAYLANAAEGSPDKLIQQEAAHNMEDAFGWMK